MTARVLVVDDIVANVKLLEARLKAEYFEVLTATSGFEALDIAGNSDCDIIILDIMMPGLDGFETCRRLKSNPKTAHIPVVMVTALDQPSDRVTGLEAGADDFLTKPIKDVALLTRVKNLVRVKRLIDELRTRSASRGDTMAQPAVAPVSEAAVTGRVILVDDRPSSYERLKTTLSKRFDVDVHTDPESALFHIADETYDLVIVSLSLRDYDGLRLCSQLQNLEKTRALPIVIISEPENDGKLMRALDMGVSDYLVRPIDANELMARIVTQLRRKLYADQLRESVEQTMEMAIMDGLTGLHNRRYFDTHFKSLTHQAATRGKTLSLVLTDIDFFKSINDTHGHDVGDEVLREFGDRIRRSVRGADLACRYGGEEFVLILPDSDQDAAAAIAERLRARMDHDPIPVAGGQKQLTITISLGVSTIQGPEDTAEAMLKRADEALYKAKRDGRNRVMLAA
ncbi:PleD family two-component system response regulator [Ahrensia marina]|uniref:PleD family two-component system response regulator n=1 Tax=Ahrensia marina TaxID=1514904 RepID=UPI0035D000DF